MSYFFRCDKKKKGLYLQMYERYWDRNIKQARTRCIRFFGYYDDLKTEDVSDPLDFYKKVVEEENNRKTPYLSAFMKFQLKNRC